jgi:hypothetical protein
VYTEVPGLPAPGIMDGFVNSLLGLCDLYVETGDPSVSKLFEQGVVGRTKIFSPPMGLQKEVEHVFQPQLFVFPGLSLSKSRAPECHGAPDGRFVLCGVRRSLAS